MANEKGAAMESEALRQKLAELQAELAAERQANAAKEQMLARQAKELEAAQELLTERDGAAPLAEKVGTGKIVAMGNCIFSDATGATRHAKKGDVCNPCPEDLRKLRADGVFCLT